VNGWIVNPTASLPSIGQTLDLSATSTGGLSGGATPSATKKASAPGGVKQVEEAVEMGAGLIGLLSWMLWL